MSSDELKYFDFIELYVEGNMTDLERRDFEAQLKSNVLLKTEYEKYVSCVDGIKGFYSSKIKNQLKEQDLELDMELARPLRSRFKKILLYSIAATFTLLIATYSILNFFTNERSLKEIASNYKVEDKGMPVLMSVGEDSQFNEAMNLFKLKEFQRSLTIIQSLQAENLNNDTLIFYEGVNYEMLNKTEKAISCYKKLQSVKFSIFSEKAQYRMALCYFQIDDKKNGVDLLKIIRKDSNHLYAEQAKEILKELE